MFFFFPIHCRNCQEATFAIIHKTKLSITSGLNMAKNEDEEDRVSNRLTNKKLLIIPKNLGIPHQLSLIKPSQIHL